MSSTARTLLLRAVTRAGEGDRVAGWRDARRAVAAAPDDGLVLTAGARLLALLHDHRAALDASAAAQALGLPAAVGLRYGLAREVGWYVEARAALIAGLRAAPAGDRLRDRLLEQLLALDADCQHDDAAVAALTEHLAGGRGSVSIHLQAGRIQARRGDRDAARAAAQRALAVETPTVTTRLAAAALLLDAGDVAAARRLYEALLADGGAAATAREALARLQLWRGEADAARAIAAPLGGAVAQRFDAAAAMLRGDHAAARPLLDAVIAAAPGDAEAYLWRAEARLRAGDAAAAIADADRSQQLAHSFAARAVRLLAALRPGGSVDDLTWQELEAEIVATCPDARPLLATNSSDALADLLRRALTALRGNRTPLATMVGADGELVRLPPSVSVRLASRRAMELIKIAPAAEALAALDALVAAHPESSMPLVHRGELQLWLGDHERARADLEGSIAVHRQTRWAWYGLACLDLLAGDAERALATCAEGIRVMHNSEGPVAFSYRGEAYRLLGRLDEARQQLERACAMHRQRLSSWINLALVQGAQGDGAARAATLDHLDRAAPTLLAEAAAALGEDAFVAFALERRRDGADAVLLQALAMMRGNRSSSVVTYFAADGTLRHVPQPTPVDVPRTLARIRDVLTRL